jgi:hypothetical protein
MTVPYFHTNTIYSREILEKKGILTQGVWESKIRSKIHKGNKTIMSYREFEFTNKET